MLFWTFCGPWLTEKRSKVATWPIKIKRWGKKPQNDGAFRGKPRISDRWLAFCLVVFDHCYQGLHLRYSGDSTVLVTGLLFLEIVVGVAGLAFDSVASASEEDRGPPQGWY
jgi:hypothetical protein